jgi:SEC-C motif-containing protein
MLPGTAEQLMRSRYSAYCHKLADYLFETHYPSKRPARLLESLATTFQNTKWTELEVLTTRKGKSKDKNGWVEFKAHYLQDGVPGILRENSRFVNEKGRWYYLSGQQL